LPLYLKKTYNYGNYQAPFLFLNGVGFHLLCGVSTAPPLAVKRKIFSKSDSAEFYRKPFTLIHRGDRLHFSRPALGEPFTGMGVKFYFHLRSLIIRVVPQAWNFWIYLNPLAI